jgi:cell division septation protein DedD
LANRQFRVEITAPNYETGSYNLFTDNPTPGQPFGQPMFLKSLLPPKAPPVTNNPVVTNPGVKSTPGKNNPPTKNNVPINPQPTEAAGNYTSRGVGPTDKGEYSSTAPRYEGDYFKVQLVALSNYNPNDVRFAKLKDLGEIQLENITAQNLNRVLVATFFTAAEAKKAMNEAKKRGFVQSFIVKYQNGARYGRVNL